VGEAGAKPITSILADELALEPRKAVATIVLSAELFNLGKMTDEILGREMRAAVGAAVDAEFIEELIDETTPIASTGNFLYDLETMLSTIAGSATSKFYLAIEPANARRLAVMEAATGGRAYP
jgi:hypothetical protein